MKHRIRPPMKIILPAVLLTAACLAVAFHVAFQKPDYETIDALIYSADSDAEWNSALKTINAEINAFPDDAKLRSYKQVVLRFGSKYREVRESVEGGSPPDDDALSALVMRAETEKQREEALGDINAAIHRFPGELRLRLCRLGLLRVFREKDALRTVEADLADFPDAELLHMQRLNILLPGGQYAAAKEEAAWLYARTGREDFKLMECVAREVLHAPGDDYMACYRSIYDRLKASGTQIDVLYMAALMSNAPDAKELCERQLRLYPKEYLEFAGTGLCVQTREDFLPKPAPLPHDATSP